MSGIALALENYPDADQNDWFEIIEGVKTMAASARFNHNMIASTIFSCFDEYFFRSNLKALAVTDVDVHLPDGNLFRPDVSVIDSAALIGDDGKIHGVPELVVEVLSPSTQTNDLGIKKMIYERNGVREYWLVNPLSKDIYVYKLDDGYYKFDTAYHFYTQAELDTIPAAERNGIKEKIPVDIFPGLVVDINRIFKRVVD